MEENLLIDDTGCAIINELRSRCGLRNSNRNPFVGETNHG